MKNMTIYYTSKSTLQNIMKYSFQFLDESNYFVHKRCRGGSKIMKVKECKSACNELEIPLSSKPFKNGKPCFRGGNGKCFQNGRRGKKAKLICTKKGILLDVVYALMTDIIST